MKHLLLRASVAMAVNTAAAGSAAECSTFYTSAATPEIRARAKACRAEKEKARLGTYFCYIEQMVGIQYHSNGKETDYNTAPFTGKIKPNSDKFFVELKTNENAEFCQQMLDKGDDSFCDHLSVAPYIIKTESSDVISYAQSFDTYQFTSFDGTFWMYGNKMFKSTLTSGNSYIAQGKCEKIK